MEIKVNFDDKDRDEFFKYLNRIVVAVETLARIPESKEIVISLRDKEKKE